MLKKIVARNIRDRRLKLGMTQAELANSCGMDVRYINRAENVPQNIGLEHLERLAEALRIPASSLLNGKQKSNADINELDAVISILNGIKERCPK
jgi:transcriptional regulator with XRE-family HTH domain